VDECVVLVGVVKKRNLREPRVLRKPERPQNALGTLRFFGNVLRSLYSCGGHGDNTEGARAVFNGCVLKLDFNNENHENFHVLRITFS